MEANPVLYDEAALMWMLMMGMLAGAGIISALRLIYTAYEEVKNG